MSRDAIETSIAEAIVCWEMIQAGTVTPDASRVFAEAQRRMDTDLHFRFVVELHARCAEMKAEAERMAERMGRYGEPN